jgi:hypothetical protein
VHRIGPALPDTPSVRPLDPATRLRLRVQGRNLIKGGAAPEIRVDGQPARVLEATSDSLVVAVPQSALAGAMTLVWPDGEELHHDIAQGGAG